MIGAANAEGARAAREEHVSAGPTHQDLDTVDERTGVDEESAGSIKEYVYTSNETGVYRKIRVFGNRLVGAIAIGDWHEASLLNDAIQNKKRLGFSSVLIK